MFRIFKPKKEPKKPANISELMDNTVNFMTQLSAIGGFGYVVFGVGFVVLASAIALPIVMKGAFSSLMIISISLITMGYIAVIVDKILMYRLANMKLKMIISVTETAVNRGLCNEPEKRLETAVIKVLVKEVLSEIWGMEWRAESTNLSRDNQKQ